MYIPHYFKNENLQEVKDFLMQNSFGILISTAENRYWGSHIPLELEQDELGQNVLYGHLSKANPQWKNLPNETEVLTIFNGPHAYVSSSWYNHENVPTWNYIAVHVYGEIQILEEEELMSSLKKLVDKYEAHSEDPITMEGMSEQTIRQVKGIVGFKIIIKDIQAAYKLSQNREDEDYHTIINKLDNTNEVNAKGVADKMKEKR